jgi:hypothetical protein
MPDGGRQWDVLARGRPATFGDTLREMTVSHEQTVLDLAQLQRIQGTHRGFLYQHLYAVACLLKGNSANTRIVRVERDEDIELVRDDEIIYAQVKTRAVPLAPSDLHGVLERFQALRQAHRTKSRSGKASFAIVANVELGPTLAQHAWPSDVLVLTPSTSTGELSVRGLVVPATSIDALFAMASEAAEGFRHSALRPDSLVSKLVGLVAAAAANVGRDKEFAVADLDRYCELVASQVRPLPVVSNYRPQMQEAALPLRDKAVIVSGYSGDGKSTWAAQLAAHSSEVAVYLPCSPVPGEQIAPRLVDAIVATLVARGTVRAHELVLPGKTGLDALALLDVELARRGQPVLAIIDDCHHATADTIVAAKRAAPNVRWIFLGQPGASVSGIAARLSLAPQSLGGWSDDVIAELLADAKCSSGPAHVAELRKVTGGAPLFVLHAVRAIRSGDHDTSKYARSLLAGTSAGRSAQEVLLEGVVVSLEANVGRVVSALAAVDVSLTTDEWASETAHALALPRPETLRAVRAACTLGVAHRTGGDTVRLHDAFRPLVADRFVTLDEVRSLRERMADLLKSQLLNERAAENIVAYMRILASLGRLSDLADTSTALAEWIRETGTVPEVRGLLEAALKERGLDAEDEFWALDTLAFFDIEEDNVAGAAERLPRMRLLGPSLDDHARGALNHKEALLALRRADITALRAAVAACSPDPRYSRILRYHGALGEAQAGNVQLAVETLLGIAKEYLALIGLTPESMFAKNPPELRKLMALDADRDDILHLADCYDAIAKYTRRAQREDVGALPALWAMKFYEMAGAPRSALSAGQDVADMMLGVWDDAIAARDFMVRSLLPAAARLGLPDKTFLIRAQYAVICAYCGDFAVADGEMKALTPYIPGLSSDGAMEIQRQQRIIERLRGTALPSPAHKIGRNDRCPCGSGLKFKKCHGRS